MGLLKRLSFASGLLLGIGAVVAAGTGVLVYLFTGKVPWVELEAKDRWPVFRLLTVEEVVSLVKDRVLAGLVYRGE